MTACRGHRRALALADASQHSSLWQERVGSRNNPGEQELLLGCTSRSREMTREGICFYFQAELSQSVCPQRSPVVINCPGPSKAARQCLWCAHRQSPVRKEQGHRKMLWHRRGSPLWIQNCTRRLQAGDTRTQISVLAPTNALLWNRESEQGDAAPQEIHIEMELKITVAWDWIAPHWVSSLAANEPPRRIKLFPGLLGSWV